MEQNKVISKFYYTVDIKRDNTPITLGIHQEDDQALGGYLKENLDMGLVILEDDEQYFWVHDYLEFRRERDLFFQTTLDHGTYHIIPVTTGVFLRRPYKLKIQKVPINLISSYKYSKLHPYIDCVLTDLFRKADLRCNSLLEANELNSFGDIIRNKYLQGVIQPDFNKDNFDKSCCTKKGLTEYGFKTIMMQEVRNHLNFSMPKTKRNSEKL